MRNLMIIDLYKVTGKDQLWTIMGDFGDLFFNGSPYLKNTFMDLSGDLVFKEKA